MNPILKKMEMEREFENEQHKTIIRFLFMKGYIIRHVEKGFKVTDKGHNRIKTVIEDLSLEDIALILIMFCNDEGIKYTENGVEK